MEHLKFNKYKKNKSFPKYPTFQWHSQPGRYNIGKEMFNVDYEDYRTNINGYKFTIKIISLEPDNTFFGHMYINHAKFRLPKVIEINRYQENTNYQSINELFYQLPQIVMELML